MIAPQREYQRGTSLEEQLQPIRDEMTDTIQPAEQNSPTDCPVLSNNNEDDLHGLVPLFIKQHIQLLLSPSKAHKARRDQLRKPVGPPTTALDLKEITQKYLVSAVDRDEVYAWSNEALGYLLERVLQSNMHDYQELDKEVERLQGYLNTLSTDDDKEEDVRSGRKQQKDKTSTHSPNTAPNQTQHPLASQTCPERQEHTPPLPSIRHSKKIIKIRTNPTKLNPNAPKPPQTAPNACGMQKACLKGQK